MPPQQSDRPLDLFDHRLGFRAHRLSANSDLFLRSPDVAIASAGRNRAFPWIEAHTMNDPQIARLIGTWKLISVVSEDLATGEKTDSYGPNPRGFINYSPEGRMMVINTRSDRKKPAGPAATPQEADALFRSVLSYAGTYTVADNAITHHVEISWNEAWTGTKQTRMFRFDGERVHFSTQPTADPVTGRMSVRTITWEKLK
jgi:Lipocalin-like domain